MTGDAALPGACGLGAYLQFLEEYAYAYPAGGSARVPLTVNWSGSHPVAGGGTASDTTNHTSQILAPGSRGTHQHDPRTPFNVTTSDPSPTAIVTMTMSLTWKNPDGTQGNSPAQPVSLTCGGKP